MDFVMSECNDDWRNKTYQWREPKICSDKDVESVRLKSPEKVRCRGCGRG